MDPRARFHHHIERSLQKLLARIEHSLSLPASEIERAYGFLTLGLQQSGEQLWPIIFELMQSLAPLMDQAGQRARWIDSLTRVIERCQQAGAFKHEAELSLHLALLYQKIGEWDIASRLLHASIEYFAETEDNRNHGLALSQSANLNRLQGNLSVAVANANSAFDLLDESSFERNLGYVALGAVALDRGETDHAIVCFEKALQLCQDHDKPLLAAMRERALGWAHCQRAEFEIAKTYLESSITTFQERNDLNELAISYMNLGIVWSKANQPERALDLYADAQAILQQQQDYAHLAALHNNKGMEYIALKRWANAEEAFLLSVKLHQRLKNRLYLCGTLSNLADAYVGGQKKNDARRTLKKALFLIESNMLDSGEQDVSLLQEKVKIEQKLSDLLGH